MKFFGKDLDQDRLFLELRAKYYLALWIASDIENFACAEDIKIGSLTKQRAYDQFLLAVDLTMEADDIKQFTKGDHKKCLNEISKHAKAMLELFNIDGLLKRTEKEDTFDTFAAVSDQNKNFHKAYKKFINEDCYENKIFLATSQFEVGFIETLKFLANMNESINPDQIAKQAKIQKEIFSKAEDFLALTLNSEKSYEVFVSEFEILAGRLKPSKANNGLKKYYLHQLVNSTGAYIKTFKEMCFVGKLFHQNIEDDIEFLASTEFNFIFAQLDQYQALLTRYAIENCLMELKILQVDMPHIEIFSGRLIKDPVYEVIGQSFV